MIGRDEPCQDLPSTIFIRSFTTLPAEILIQILEYLDYQSLLRCSLVCRNMDEIIIGSSRLKYSIELAAAGRVSNAVLENIPASSLLADLVTREQAWNSSNVELGLFSTLSLPKHRSVEWDFVGGVYVKPYTVFEQLSPTSQSEHYVVEVYDLSSTDDDLPTWSWRSNKQFLGFCVDPAADAFLGLYQDLRRVGTVEVHVLSLRTGRRHPDSAFSPIHLDFYMCDCRKPIVLQMFGNLVAVSLHHHQVLSSALGPAMQSNAVNIIIADWKIGRVLYTIEMTSWLDFCFASHNVILTAAVHPYPNCDQTQVEVYRIDEHGDPITCPEEFVDTKPKVLQPVAVFLLPAMTCAEGTQWLVQFRFAPATDRSRVYPFSWNVIPNEMQLLAVEMVRTSGPTQIHQEAVLYGRFTFYVQSQTFLNHERFQQDVAPRKQVPIISWETWGPPNTRCFVNLPPHARNIYGWRLALSDCILNFNQLDIARDLQAYDNVTVGGLVMHPTIIPCGAFVKDVVTMLPYRVGTFRCSIDQPIRRIMLDEDIIGLEFDADGHETLHVIGVEY